MSGTKNDDGGGGGRGVGMEIVPTGLPPKPGGGAGAGAMVEYDGKKTVTLREDEEDIEVKLRRIMENVPLRVSNTSGSSAGSGSGDFHQYRQMRRKEQDRVSRMESDYQRRKELAEFNLRREERLKAAEERTAKKRLKRQKKKQKKKEKKSSTSSAGDGSGQPGQDSSDSEISADDSDTELKHACSNANGPTDDNI